MRDPDRIGRILGMLEDLWSPPGCNDMRLGQLLINLGVIPDSEAWFTEDDEIEKHLKTLVEEDNRRRRGD